MQVIGKALQFDPVAMARQAEDRGYDGVRVIDHFFSGIPPEPPRAVPHSMTTLAAAAVATERVMLTQTMIAVTFRHPVEVAQSVATVDRISRGRAELGLGTGWLGVEHDALGLDLGTPAERVDRLAEAAAICRSMFENDGRVSFGGRFFRAEVDAPWPATPHQPDILIGAHGPRMLRTAARYADRIDLLEALSSSGPRFDGDHGNTEANLRRRIETASTAEGARTGLRFSATVNLVVAADSRTRDEAAAEIAAVADCVPDLVLADLLRVVTLEDEALHRIARLADLGIDRLHIRPVDDHSQAWLDENLARLQGLG